MVPISMRLCGLGRSSKNLMSMGISKHCRLKRIEGKVGKWGNIGWSLLFPLRLAMCLSSFLVLLKTWMLSDPIIHPQKSRHSDFIWSASHSLKQTLCSIGTVLCHLLPYHNIAVVHRLLLKKAYRYAWTSVHNGTTVFLFIEKDVSLYVFPLVHINIIHTIFTQWLYILYILFQPQIFM